MASRLELIALEGFPLVEPGDDLCRLLVDSLHYNGLQLQAGDVLVLAQKIVSKPEGRYVRLTDIAPGPEAIALVHGSDRALKAESICECEEKVLPVKQALLTLKPKQQTVITLRFFEKLKLNEINENLNQN